MSESIDSANDALISPEAEAARAALYRVRQQMEQLQKKGNGPATGSVRVGTVREMTRPKSLPTELPPKVSDFMDHRGLLQAFLDYKRRTDGSKLRPYSYAVFAAAADIKSPNYLKLVIEGQRNISDDMAQKFGRAMGFNKAQVEEFQALVRYCQAEDPSTRNQFLKQLNEIRYKTRKDKASVGSKTWETIPSWLSWTLLHMVDQANVNFDPEQLHRLLGGRTQIETIRRALEGLIQSGLVERDPETHQLRKTKHLLEAPSQIPSDLIRKIQSELVLMGVEALFNEDPHGREAGSLTLCLTDSEFEELKFELRHLRKKLHREFSAKRAASPGDRVYQLNLQLFPLTRKG